jgi:hypothetical protein
MTAVVDTTLEQVLTEIGTFIVAQLGLATGQLVVSYPNRASNPPAGPGWIDMTVATRTRLNTNIDGWDMTIDDPTMTTQESHWQLGVQIDCYGPVAEQWVLILETLFRDEVGCDALTFSQPLYADEGTRAPVENDSQQYENRWVMTAYFQYDPVVSTAQDFADTLTIDLVNVYERYPP